MSRLSDVLVALDKAKMIMHGDEQKDASLVLITTAPDMAAWIKKALRVLQQFDEHESMYTGYAESQLEADTKELIKEAI